MDNKIRDFVLKKMGKIVQIGMVLIVCSAVAVGQDRMSQVEKSSMVYNGIPITQDAAESTVLNKIISITIQDIPLLEAVEKIAEKANLEMVYNSKLLAEKNRSITINLEQVTVGKALWAVLEETGLRFAISADKQLVLLERKEAKHSLPSISAVIQETITGTVTDGQSGETLPGVNILVKGTTTGASTDQNGNFELTVPSLQDTLIVTYIGYQEQEIPLNGQNEFDIQLSPEAIMGEEMVVVGYGEQKRENLTGSVSHVSSERLENRSISSSGRGLQGVIPNLNISVPDGDPTTAASYNIRGYESINGGGPLILVDGVPMDLERINPNDISSVTVLKDASAAAVYGARGAFGVVLVETKSGTSDELQITFNTEQSISKSILNFDFIKDPHLAVQTWNEAEMRTNGQPRYDDDYVRGTKTWSENPTFENAWGVVGGELRYYGNNDYQNELLNDFAHQSKYDLTASRAWDETSYHVSLSYFNKPGYLENSDKNEQFKRYNILAKLDHRVNDWLKLEEKVMYNSTDSNKPHFYNWDVNINSVARVSPMMPVQFPDLPYYIEEGDREKYEQYIGMYFGGTNFFPYLEEGGRTTFTENDLWLTQGITLDPLQGLVIEGDFTFNTYSKNYRDVASQVQIVSPNLLTEPMVDTGFSENDFIEESNNYNEQYMVNIHAEYVLDQFDDHDITAMVGFNQEWGHNRYSMARANSLITPQITNISSTTGNQQTNGSESHVALRGAFYRFNYIYQNKYLVEANGRYDGTSRFSEEDRWGFFPSFSAGWRVSNEPFLNSTNEWLDNLMIRASYGELGNQLLGSNYYPYISTMGSGMADLIMSSSGGRTPYVSASGLVSPMLTWEKVATQNVGMDIFMLDQRLELTFDAYIRDTKDMLMDVVYPDLLGTEAPQANAADLRTKGWEISLGWQDRMGQDWNYHLNLSLSDNQSEITEYENPTGTLSDHYEGKKMGEIRGYVTEGIFQNEQEVIDHADQSQLGNNWRPGDIKYADLNGDGVITPGSNTLEDSGDRQVIGNNTPRYSYGINSDLSYKNWTLNVFFHGLLKRDYLPPGESNWQAFYPFKAGHLEHYYLTDTWSEDNRDAYFAAPHISSNNHKNTIDQSRYVQNAAYIRLKNLTLNYSLPPELFNRVGISGARIYLTGTNLWEYSKMRDPLDPESVGTLTQQYWLQRTFTMGINVTL